jgi:hypothetical protein
MGRVVPARSILAHLESEMDKRTHAEYNDFSQKKIAKRWLKKDTNSNGRHCVHSAQR